MKKGFTLIELMVVVVIIGILAAVAVPKLFGMIAKSKASEVGPAAGEYIKLQNAYMSETNKAGNWYLIGYNGPGNWVSGSEASSKSTQAGASSESTNFTYEDKVAGSQSSMSSAAAWQTKSKAKLNDCAKGSTWTVKITFAAEDAGNATYASTVDGTGCSTLTPSFTTIK